MKHIKRILSLLLITAILTGLCVSGAYAENAGVTVTARKIANIGKVATLTGKTENAENITYLSDLYNTDAMVDSFVIGKNSSIANPRPFKLDTNWDLTSLYVYTADDADRATPDSDTNPDRWAVGSSYAETGRVLSGNTYYPDDIAIGGLGKQFDKGLGFLASPKDTASTNYPDATVVYDLRGLDADYFYSVVGLTGTANNGSTTDKLMNFEVWASKADTYSENAEFVKLAYAQNVRAWLMAEFEVNIAGYNFLKLVGVNTSTATSSTNSGLSGVWADACVYKTPIPGVETNGTATQHHDAGSENYQVVYSDVTAAEVAAYEQKLAAAGYTLYDQNTIGSNRFATYVTEEQMIHLNYFPALEENQFHIVYGPNTCLLPNTPIVDAAYEAVVTPSVSIIEMTDSVLCMVVQMADGSFVVIDGGYGYSGSTTLSATYTTTGLEYTFERNHQTDMTNLLNFLEEMTPGEGKPQITWMITHADPDHIQLPYVFIRTYSSRIDVNAVCYNFPNFYNVGLSSSYNPETFTGLANSFLSTINTYYPDAEHYIYHTGQKLYLPGGEIEFLFTPEDLWPKAMTSMNHTSGMWRFTINGQTVMITGDAEKPLNQQAAAVFGDYLKSDILQVVHHGSNGGSVEFYNAVDPSICFWPCQQEYLEVDKRHLGTWTGFEFNTVLWESENVTAHYSNSETYTVYLTNNP